MVGTARCAVRAAFSGATFRANNADNTKFRPLNAGGDTIARCPYHRNYAGFSACDNVPGGTSSNFAFCWRNSNALSFAIWS
jgi:hypothetical protein